MTITQLPRQREASTESRLAAARRVLLDERESWPRQIVLPGQTSAAHGPHDLAVPYLVHHAVRRDLDRFEVAFRETPGRDRAAWRALARRWAMTSTLLRHQQDTELTALWPPLLAEVTQQDWLAVEVLEHGEAHHETIARRFEAVAAGLDYLARAPHEGVRATVRDDLALTRRAVDRHLRHVETNVLPLFQQHLTAEEWRGYEAALLAGPADAAARAFLVPWLSHDVRRWGRTRLFARLDRERVLRWQATRRIVEWRERRTFRYLLV